MKELQTRELVRLFLPLGLSTLMLVILFCGLSQASQATEAEPSVSSAETSRERLGPHFPPWYGKWKRQPVGAFGKRQAPYVRRMPGPEVTQTGSDFRSDWQRAKNTFSSLVCTTGVSTCEQTKNEVLNPGFEEGADHWTESDPPCVFSYDEPGFDGGVSARIVGTSAQCKLRQYTNVTPDRSYDYVARIKADLVNGEAYLGIKLWSCWGDDCEFEVFTRTASVVHTHGDWVTVTGSVTTPGDAEYVKARVEATLTGPSDGSAWFDDIFFGLATCLDISKRDDPHTVKREQIPGQILTYTIVCSNTGRERATNVWVVETYDDGDVVGFDHAQPPPDMSDNVWMIPELLPDESYPITVWMKVKNDAKEERNWLFNNVQCLSNETISNPVDITISTVITPLTSTCSLAISPPNDRKPGIPANPTDYEVELRNTGGCDGQVDLVVASSRGWTVTVEPSPPYTLPVGGHEEVTVSPVVPLGTGAGITDVTTITATMQCGSPCNGQAIATGTFTTTVALWGSVALEPDNSDSAIPGDVTTYTHTLTNETNVPQTVTLAVDSSGGCTPTVKPTTTESLDPWGDWRVVTVTVPVPDSALGGTVCTTVITATGTTIGQDTATDITIVPTGTVTLAPAGHTGSAAPDNVIIYTHTLTNETNVPQTVTLAIDSSRGCTPTVKPTTTESLDPWVGWTVVTVTVSVPGDALGGMVYTTVVTARGTVTGQDTATDTTTVALWGSVALEPDNSDSAIPGDVTTYTHTLTNETNVPQTVTLAVDSSGGYISTVEPTTTESLDPWGDWTVVTVTVPVSGGALGGTVYTTVVTATGAITGQDTATDITNILIVPLEDVKINGPRTGNINTSYTFTATVSPTTATEPITYVWQATEQNDVVTHTNRGLSDTVSFAWSPIGTQTIAVTATNAVNTVTGTHIVTIEWFKIYLPVIMRCWPPIEDVPTLNSITPPGDSASYTVSWSPVEGATTYVLQEDTDIIFSDPITIYIGTATSHPVSSRCIEHYYYRVKACNSCMCTDWSEPELVEVRWECEPNNSCPPPEVGNGPLESGLTYYGTFTSTTDIYDYFYLDLSTDSVEIMLTHIQAGCDYDLAFYYDDCTREDDWYSNNPGNQNEHLLIDNLSPGRYHVLVYNYQEGVNLQSYHLQMVYR